MFTSTVHEVVLAAARDHLIGSLKCLFLAAARLFHHPMTRFVIELVF